MHIPDGFLNAPTSIVCAALSGAAIFGTLRVSRPAIPDSSIPRLGVGAACLFAAQMVNFPIPGGTSGHLLGGALATLVFGPLPAVIVMTAVVIIQCLLFADGGITALGGNLLNMAVIAPLWTHGVCTLLNRFFSGEKRSLITAGIAAWSSTVVASACCAIELSFSGAALMGILFPAMVSVHSVIGIGEALITVTVLKSLDSRLFRGNPSSSPKLNWKLLPVREILTGLAVALFVALALSPLASTSPDGLDATAKHLGFGERAAATPAFPSPLPEYTVSWFSSGPLATSTAGALGVIALFMIFLTVFFFLRRGSLSEPGSSQIP